MDRVLDYLFHISLGDIFEILTFIGFGVFLFRLVILRKAPVPSSSYKKIPRELFQKCINTLKKQDKGAYDAYVVPHDIMTALQADMHNEVTLKRLLCSICEHMGINGEYIKLVVLDVFASDRAGEISTDLAFTTIKLEMKQGYTLDAVIAILAHEATHLHLYYKGIHFRDPWENEVLTDTAAVYCGFGEYIYKGYAVMQGNFALEYQKVGYIRQEDVKFIESLMNE